MELLNLTADLKLQLAAVQSAWDMESRDIQNLRRVDALQNMGGQGYSAYNNAAERLAKKYMTQVSALRKAIFEAEWDAETTQTRRAAWNAEMQKIARLDKHAQGRAIRATAGKLGFGYSEIVRAMALNNLK